MGYNRDSELGDGTSADRHFPEQIVSGNVTMVAAGWSDLIKRPAYDVHVHLMGDNTYRELGDGTYASRLTPVQVMPLVLPQPTITGLNISGINLVLNGSNGQSGRTYFTLMSTNASMPLNQWIPVATNLLGADGDFTINATNAVNPSARQGFYSLRLQ